MYTSRYRSSSPLGARYRSPSATRSLRDSYTPRESYNSVSAVGSLNPSIRRVQDLDLGISKRPSNALSSETRFGRSLSPSFRHSSNADSKWSSQRCSNDISDLSYSSKTGSLDYTFRVGRPYSSTPLSFSSFRSASKRVDYSDFIKPVLKPPVLRERPVLKKNYIPRSRAEREKDSVPITRDRKLIKFREVTGDVRSIRRKLSWAIPDDPESFSVNELHLDSSDIKTEDLVRSRESSLSRIRSRENSLTRLHSPRASLSGGSSRESSLSRLRSPRTSAVSCKSRDQGLTGASKPPAVSSEKCATNRRPSNEFSIETSIPKPKRRGYSDSSNLTSHGIQRSYDKTTAASAVCEETVSEKLHSENSTLKVGSYDTQSLRQRRRRDSPAELETEKNEAADTAVDSHRRRRHSRSLKTTDENKISRETNKGEEHKSLLQNKIGHRIDQNSITKYSKNSSEKSFLLDSAQSKGKSCVQSPEKQEISVSYVLPVPKQRTRADCNRNSTFSTEKSSTAVNQDALARRAKSDIRVVSNADDASQENIVSFSLKFDKPKSSVGELKGSESKLVKDVLKIKNDRVMPSTKKLTETITRDEENVFVLNRKTGKLIAPLKTEEQLTARKTPLVAPLTELSTNITDNKKSNIRGVLVETNDNFSAKNVSSDTSKSPSDDKRFGVKKDQVNLELETTVSEKNLGNRTDKKSNWGVRSESAQDVKTDGTKIFEYTQKKVGQEVGGQKTLKGVDSKLSEANQKARDKINAFSKTETVSSKLERNEGNSTNISENKKHIPRYTKMEVQDKAQETVDSVSEQKRVTQDRGLNVDIKSKIPLNDIDTAPQKVSEKKVFVYEKKLPDKASKIEARNDDMGKDVRNDGKGSPVLKDINTAPKHSAEINSSKRENKTAVTEDVGVKLNSAIEKDSEIKFSSTFQKKSADDTTVLKIKNLKLDRSDEMTLKNADIHSDTAVLKYSEKKTSSKDRIADIHSDITVLKDSDKQISSKDKNADIHSDTAVLQYSDKKISSKNRVADIHSDTTVLKDSDKQISSKDKNANIHSDIAVLKDSDKKIFSKDKNADIHSDTAILKDSVKKIPSIDNCANNSAVVENKNLKTLSTDNSASQSSNTENERKTFIPRLGEKVTPKSKIDTIPVSRQNQSEERKSKTEIIMVPLSKDAVVKIDSGVKKDEKVLRVAEILVDSASKIEAKVPVLQDIKHNETTEICSNKRIPRLTKMSLPVEKGIGTPADAVSKVIDDVKVKTISGPKGSDAKISATAQKEFVKALSNSNKQSVGNTGITEPKDFNLGHGDKNAFQKDGVSVLFKQDTNGRDLRIVSSSIPLTKDTDVKTNVTAQTTSKKKSEEKGVDSGTKTEGTISKLENAEKNEIQKTKPEQLETSEKSGQKITGVAADVISIHSSDNGNLGMEIPSLPKSETIEKDATVRKVSGRSVLELEKKCVDITSEIHGQDSKTGSVAKGVQHENVENKSKSFIPPFAKTSPQGDVEKPTDVTLKNKESANDSTLKFQGRVTPVPKENEVILSASMQKNLDNKVTASVDSTTDSISKTEIKTSKLNSVATEVDVNVQNECNKQIPRLAMKLGKEVTEENVSAISRRQQGSENTSLLLEKEIIPLTKDKVPKVDATANKFVEEPKGSKYVNSLIKTETIVGDSKEPRTVSPKIFDSIKSTTANQNHAFKDNEENTEKMQSQLPLVTLKTDDKNLKKDIHVTESKAEEKIFATSKIPTSVQKVADERVFKQKEKTASLNSEKTLSSFTADINKDATENKAPEPMDVSIDKNLQTNRREENSSTDVANVEIDVRLKIKKGRRISKDGLPKDFHFQTEETLPMASIQAEETRKNLPNKDTSDDHKTSDKPEKFAFTMAKFKTASAIAWTGEDSHADTVNEQDTYAATELETVDFSLNLKEILRIPREENISANLKPVRPIFTDIPVTIGKANISRIEEEVVIGSLYFNLSSSEDTKFNSVGKIDSVSPKSEFETENKIGHVDSKKVSSGENTSTTQNEAIHSKKTNAISPALPYPGEMKEDITVFTKPAICNEMTHDLSKPKETTEVSVKTCGDRPIDRTFASGKEQILAISSTEITPKEECHASKLSQISESRNSMGSPVESPSKNLVQGSVEPEFSQVSKEHKICTSFLKGELPPPRNKTPEQKEISDKNATVINRDKSLDDFKAKALQLSKQMLLFERTTDRTSDSNTPEEQGQVHIIQGQVDGSASDFTKGSIQDNTASSKTTANSQVPEKKSEHLSVTEVSNKTQVSQAKDTAGTTELTTSDALLYIPLALSESSEAGEKISECKSPDDLKTRDISSLTTESTVKMDRLMKNTGKISPDANVLNIGKLVLERVETPPPQNQKDAIRTQSPAAEKNEPSLENRTERGSVEPDNTECTKITVCVQEAKIPKTENVDFVSASTVNARTKESAICTTVPGVESSSEDESSSEETSSEEEESSLEGEESTSDDDNRLPGNWGTRNANIVPAKKKRFIGLVTKTALNENVSSLDAEQPNDGRLSESDERARNRSQLSSQGSVGDEDTYISFSSLISSPMEGSPRLEDSPRRTSTTSQQDKYLKLRFRKYTIDDFQFLKLLGKGSFGKVLLAELKGHDMYFAIKCLKKDVVLEDDDVESTMIERRILALGTQHPYMCKLYCAFQTDSHLFFVMEYLHGGDLMFHIQESGRFDQDRARFYAAEITSALKFLHRKGIIYRDIKLDNIVMDEQGHIRLVDFGMCQCRIYKEECMPFNFCGTPQYIAPEIVMGQTYNQSVDWWSFGVLLYEMLTGRSPFNGTDEDELFWSICNEEPQFPRFLTKEARQLIELLLMKNPSQRLGMPACSAGDITAQPFFSSINWTLLENKQIQPPFKPSIRSPSDTSNFDSSFTMDSATLSPVESDILQSMDQTQFRGFSYTNPNIVG